MRSARVSVAALAVFVVAILISGCGLVAKQAPSTTEKLAVRVASFASVARTAEEAKNIWQKDFNTRLLSETTSAAEIAPSLGVHLVTSTGSETGEQAFTRLLSESSADVVTLVGHNQGGYFRFPDGTYIDLQTLGQSEKLIAMISCNSIQYANGSSAGLPGYVGLDVAFTVQSRLTAKVQSLSYSPDVAEVQGMLVATLNEVASERSVRIRYSLAGGGTIAGITIWQVLD